MYKDEQLVPVATDRDRREDRHPSWWALFLRHFPIRDFVVGGVVPYAIFSFFQRQGQPLSGVMLAGVWGLAMVLFGWWRTGRLQAFAFLAVVFAAIQFVTTILTRNPAVYVLSGVINNTVEGLIYFVSVWLPRPLIQIAAEATGALDAVPDDLRRSPAYRRAWQILTAVWGIANLAKAILLFAAQQQLPQDAVLALGVLTGWPLTIALLAFTFWFPGRYWSRHA